MAKKLDLSGAKDFLFRYGERIGLFTCIGLALLLVVWGLAGAAGPGTASGKPWAEEIKREATNLEQRIRPAGEVKPEDVKVDAPNIDWVQLRSAMSAGPYIALSENTDLKRRNPEIVPVLVGDENFQIDYLYRGFVGYDVQQNNITALAGGADVKGPMAPGVPVGPMAVPPGAPGAAGVAGTGPALAHLLHPRQMLVVTGIFPMKKQVDEFVKALRVAGVSELVATKDLPQVIGINVIRDEKAPDGTVKRTDLIKYDVAQKKLNVEPALDKELREAIYDEANPQALEPVIHEGLVTPLPLLPEGLSYPKLRIKGDFWPKDMEVAAANPAAPGAPGAPGATPMAPGILPPAARPAPGILPPGVAPKGMPMGVPGVVTGAEAAEVPTQPMPIKKLKDANPELYQRLIGNYNIFHPFGSNVDEQADANEGAAPPGAPPMAGGQATGPRRFGFAAAEGGQVPGAPGGNGPMAMPMAPPGKFKTPPGKMPVPPGPMNPGVGVPGVGAGRTIYDAIVRFVDVDVKPGYTYQYQIQVRIQNPNFGKRNEVAQLAWADVKELLSPVWTPTPVVTIPGGYHLFAVDQFNYDQMGEKDPKAATNKARELAKKMDSEHAVVQLHRWFDRGGESSEYLVGDWAIAERLIVRKGDWIGGRDLITEIPTWNKGRGSFEMRETVPPAIKGKPAPRAQKGVPLNFIPKEPGPLLVDFDGGRRSNTKLGIVNDDAAADLLILMPDGKLIVRNSRADIDVPLDDLTPDGTTRQARVVEWRQRNQRAISGESGGVGAVPPGTAPPIMRPPGR